MSGKRIVLAASRTESNERDQDCWVQMLFATRPVKIAHYLTDLNCLGNELREDGQARYVPNGLRVVLRLDHPATRYRVPGKVPASHGASAALEQEGLMLKEVFE